MAVIIQPKPVSPGEAAHLSTLQIQLSAPVQDLFAGNWEEGDKVTPMADKNKLRRFLQLLPSSDNHPQKIGD